MIGRLLDIVAAAKARVERSWRSRRVNRLRDRGLHIGRDVLLPASTMVDADFAYLISIGDSCAFGPGCMLMVHDEATAGLLGAVRLGAITLHASCHIGARTLILPGVSVGPRTIVAANSVVSQSLPPDTVCAGNPARPIGSLEKYLRVHTERSGSAPAFQYDEYSIEFLTPQRRALLVASVLERDAYMLGGRTAELREKGGSERTPFGEYVPLTPHRMLNGDEGNLDLDASSHAARHLRGQ